MDEIQLAENLTIGMMPIVEVFLIGIVALWIKDFIASAAKGVAFYSNRAFGEGDRVKIDDADAIIVKIGLRQTVFSIIKRDGDYVWRYVPNEMISMLKLEKVIYDADSRQNQQKIEENASSILNNTETLTAHIDDTSSCAEGVVKSEKIKSRYENP
jgi:hypothetical protein